MNAASMLRMHGAGDHVHRAAGDVKLHPVQAPTHARPGRCCVLFGTSCCVADVRRAHYCYECSAMPIGRANVRCGANVRQWLQAAAQQAVGAIDV